MRAIEIVTAHFKEHERQFVDVPEWQRDGVPLRIYWRLMTYDDRRRLLRSGTTDVDIFVAMATDANGEKLFTIEDKPLLRMRADSLIIARIVRRMIGTDRLTNDAIEDAEKNSEAIPSD